MRIFHHLALTCLLATACAGEESPWPDDDPPDPIYPANGWWQVVEWEKREIDCGGAHLGYNQSVRDVWVRVLDERLHIGWGTFGAWTVREARCPVNQFGAFFCPPYFTERIYNDYDITLDIEVRIRGGNRGDDTPMTFVYHRISRCTGADCTNPVCEFEEISQLVHRGYDLPPGF